MDGANDKPHSLREYLLKQRRLEQKINAKIVLAETANQLYRDTDYGDLITFEEDVAIIASVVLLIAESAGSLAELGAFATSPQIRPSLSVIMRTDHFEAESFVRFGPVQKIMADDDTRIAAFPWRMRDNGTLIKSSAKSHFSQIKKFVEGQISSKAKTFLFRNGGDIQIFIIILWIIHLSRAISITEIASYTAALGYNYSQKDIKNKLYSMKLAGWIDRYSYSNKGYWHPITAQDPFARYSFKHATADRDSARRKLEVIEAIRRDLRPPSHVLKYAVAAMGVA
jgi:hypothetical protein